MNFWLSSFDPNLLESLAENVLKRLVLKLFLAERSNTAANSSLSTAAVTSNREQKSPANLLEIEEGRKQV
jgi:hypothetical protein